jgi:hypothetical protein
MFALDKLLGLAHMIAFDKLYSFLIFSFRNGIMFEFYFHFIWYIYSDKLNKLLASGGKRKYLWFKDIYKFSGMVLPRYFYILLMLRAIKQILKEF